MTAFNSKSERAITAVTVASMYSALILSFTNFYYSRYNFLIAFISSFSSFMFSMEILLIFIGGLVGSCFAAVWFKFVHND